MVLLHQNHHLTLDVQAGGTLVGVTHASLLQILSKVALHLSLNRLVQPLVLGQNPSILVGAAVIQVLAVPDDGVVVVVGGDDVVVYGRIGTVGPGDAHPSLVRGSGHDSGSVVVQIPVVVVTPPGSHRQFSGIRVRKVVCVVER